MSNAIKDRLKNLKKNYESTKNVEATEYGVKIPNSTYILELESAKLDISKASQKLMIVRNYVVVEGDFVGVTLRDYLMCEGDSGMELVYVRKWIDQMGFTAPDDLEDLEELVPQISDEHARIKAEVKYKGESTIPNVYFIELLDGGGIENEGEEEEEDTEEPEESEAEDVEEQVDEDDELTSDLHQFCMSYDLEGYNEELDKDQLCELIQEYPWKEEEMEKEEIELFEKAGIDSIIERPKKSKPKPKKGKKGK